MFNSKQRKLLFLSSSITSTDNTIDSYDYFASIASLLAIRLHKEFKKYDLVIKVPEGGELFIENQRAIIKDIANHIKEYDVIILSPTNRDEIIDSVKQILLKKICLINIDQGYSLKSEKYRRFINNELPRPYYVQADWIFGGRIAGESMIKCLSNYKKPNIVIIEGGIGSEERIKGFKEKLQTSGYSPAYEYCQGQYCKSRARNAFEALFNEKLKNKKIHGVFATNDEMALGVREFYIKNEGNLKYPAPKIIGFDGIKDLTILIQNDDEIIFDTVDVQIEEQISKLVRIIDDRVISKKNQLGVEDLYVEHPCISFREKLNQIRT